MDLLARLDKKLLKIVVEAGQLAESLGLRAYLVGGPVRDLMLKRSNVDLDITVEGNGIRLAESFSAKHPHSKLVSYPAFKTATVTLADGQQVDFATTRKETYSQGGAFPAVVVSDIKEDLFRRDFTINAMAIAIHPKSWGQLVDPYHGELDLKLKKIRILHDQSFLDDPTRILRAARFKGRLNFVLERRTLKFLKAAIEAKALETIKPQRYQKDLDKILKEKKSEEAVRCLKLWKAYKPTLGAKE
ncbi:MAG: CCA tRNA nucleotidyltransferase [Candidatus Omnitrophica bacterium]|nr:CCA tRNA nucleotidyltransferase [Candidatus Omnitrophota bacterium]